MNDLVLHPGNFISMCSGYGGLDLGLHIADPDARCVCYVEREASAAATLVARMEDEALDRAPIWSDVTTFDGKQWRGKLGGLIAGYPCQGESVAGLRNGTSDPRFIFPHIARTIFDARIPVVFCENVGAHLSMSFYAVARYMQEMGFTLAAGLFTAEEGGASHKRERLFWLGWNPEWLGNAGYDVHPRELDAGASGQEASRNQREDISQGQTPHGQRLRSQSGSSGEQLVNAKSEFPRALPFGDAAQHSGHLDASGNLVAELANTGRERTQVSSSRKQPAKQKPLGNSSEMEHTAVNGCRKRQPKPEVRFGPDATARSSSSLANTAGERCGETRQSCSRPKEWVTRASSMFQPVLDPIGEYAAEHLPLFAPGPSDYGAWIDTLESAPILEPAVHRMAYGRSSRMDRLRLTGNGVFPLAAAYAYCTLRDALTEHFSAKRANDVALRRAAE